MEYIFYINFLLLHTTASDISIILNDNQVWCVPVECYKIIHNAVIKFVIFMLITGSEFQFFKDCTA